VKIIGECRGKVNKASRPFKKGAKKWSLILQAVDSEAVFSYHILHHEENSGTDISSAFCFAGIGLFPVFVS